MLSEASIKSEECYMDAESIMKRIKQGETGRQLQKDILDLSANLNALADLILED